MKHIVDVSNGKGYCFCTGFGKQLENDIASGKGKCTQVCLGHCSVVNDGGNRGDSDFDDYDCDYDYDYYDFDEGYFDNFWQVPGWPFG